MKDLILLGATGSIGTQTFKAIENSDYRIQVITVGKNITKALELIKTYDIKYVSTLLEDDSKYIKSLYPNIEVGFGLEGIKKAISNYPGDVVNAITGIAGLVPTLYAIENNRNIYLANKETLVVAGEIIFNKAKKRGLKIVPIDSEHNAIYQLLDGVDRKNVKSLIITASGGAFRDKCRNELTNATIEDALAHPNWSMGSKITVDCASMVNKGLEVMEAHFLFDMPYDKIRTVVHKESIIHSMVEFNDGSVRALMYNPSMVIPIQNAIFGDNHKSPVPDIDFAKLGTLTFKKMDYERYPMIKLAYEVGKLGGFYPTVFNASNEKAVELFLKGKIKFLDIENIIEKAISDFSKSNCKMEYTIPNILKLDQEVKDSIEVK